MRIVRLAELVAWKYKLAISADDLEADLRKKIGTLWSYPNKNFNILRACADAGASKPANAQERKAVAGHQFCKEILSIVDYLKINAHTVSLGGLREALTHLVQLIELNKDMKFGPTGKPSKDGVAESIQFPHVSELIFQMVQVNKKHDVKLRNDLYSKARTGLSRVLSVALDMLEDIHQLEVMVPEKFKYQNVTGIDTDQPAPERFTPQRAPLSNYDIIDFIRQYGDQYGISSKEDWEVVFKDDPALKEEMTTVINALNRGHFPKDAATMRMEIAEILKRHEERKSTNAHLFEDSE
jgi:hypothetical protein